MTSSTEITPRAELNGLGGWLILIGIVVVLSFAIYVGMASRVFLEEDRLRSVPFFVFLDCAIVAMAGLAAFSVYGFFGKLKLFPRAFILFHILHVVLAVATLIFVGEAATDGLRLDIAKGAGRAVVITAYLLMSVRVRNTFTNAL